MRRALLCILATSGWLSLATNSVAQKTYKHASAYQVAILDESLRVYTGTDITAASTSTDAKLSAGGQGAHILHTAAGTFRVEAPIAVGKSILVSMMTPAYRTAPTVHNKWFLDNVAPGTKVLFASECANPSKKHPNETVRCKYWFPDPDSTSHEFETLGDFTPVQLGDGANVEKTANTLCGTHKLNPATEAEICGSTAAATGPAPLGPTPAQQPPAPVVQQTPKQ